MTRHSSGQEAANPIMGTAASGDLSGHVTLPAFIRRMGSTRSHGMEALCLTGLCWVQDGRVRLQRFHEKAGLGRRLRNAGGYPFDLLSPEGVEYARSRWSECLSSVERWHGWETGRQIERASESVGRAPPTTSLADRVALLKKEHPKLRQKEIAQAMGVSESTVKRCVTSSRRASLYAESASRSIKALEGVKLGYTSAQDPRGKDNAGVLAKAQVSRSRSFDLDYDPAEDITHDTYPDGRPCVPNGFPFDFSSALKGSLQRHAAKSKVSAPPRQASPRFDCLRPTLFPPRPNATVEEAWQALEVFRLHRRGVTDTAMEMAFLFDHFPSTPARAMADMVGVSVSTVRRHRVRTQGA